MATRRGRGHRAPCASPDRVPQLPAPAASSGAGLTLPGPFLALLVNHSLISPGSSCPARPSREAVLQGCQSVPAPFKAHTTKGKTSRGVTREKCKRPLSPSQLMFSHPTTAPAQHLTCLLLPGPGVL